MYRPPHFDENDPEMLTGIIQQHSFATVITHDGTAPFATHMPVLLHEEAGPHGTLVTHMARAKRSGITLPMDVKYWSSSTDRMPTFHLRGMKNGRWCRLGIMPLSTRMVSRA